ncbi:class I SAM-dependent methyltransferase [Teredinibacter turnerae]|uniref:class I SAM-dependent methyltransferase n=1 Tax=Teredinibacter turnerae TaxID=2426 RepID=UPI000476B51E|nr:methyltransferase domain-containing protein [Teredinibacter turnerae]
MTTSSTDKYYEENSQEYFQRTVGADISHMYANFLDLLPERAKILDAGAGSGRDLLHFSKLGYEALGIDSSSSLARLAEEYSGEKVIVSKFESMTFQNLFNGIWACASLLHSEKQLLPRILENFHNALMLDGILFISVREGKGRVCAEDGRMYTFYSIQEISSLIEGAGFDILSSWKTKDAIEGRDDLIWINIIARKTKVTP